MSVTTRERQVIEAALNHKPTSATMVDRLESAEDAGSIARARIKVAATPTAGDTITIGADVYEFQANAGAVTDDSYIAVEIDGVTNSQANLVLAINGTYSPDQHPNITNIATTAPALANGTELVWAEAEGPGNGVRIFNADAVGGSKLAGSQSIVLSETMTDAGDVWSVGNVNMNTLGAAAAVARRHTTYQVTVTADMITEGTLTVEVPFTAGSVTLDVYTSTGGKRYTANDTVAVSGTSALIVLAGGAAPDIQATDVAYLTVWE